MSYRCKLFSAADELYTYFIHRANRNVFGSPCCDVPYTLYCYTYIYICLCVCVCVGIK